MSSKSVKTDNASVSLWANGKKLATFSSALTKLEGQTVDLGPSDPTRINTGNLMLHPFGQYFASSVVTPYPTWLPSPGQINILLNILWAIKQLLDSMDERSEVTARLGAKVVRRTQVVDYSSMLPEDV